MTKLNILIGLLLLSAFFANAQQQVDDTSVIQGKSFLKYNGLNYFCPVEMAVPEQFVQLLDKFKDSAGKKAELSNALELYQWLSCSINGAHKTIVVNIPSADLILYQEGKPVFYSKVVVGKPSTPTYTVSGRLNEIVMYPYWWVPKSIAARELLPKIKKNISFLNDGGYQVLDKQGKIVNPYAVNWSRLKRDSFPYTIRQSTGCDNSLGIIKFNFYNPYSAYLHDTPEKELFGKTNRFYSHGCIRVEKAIELGELIMGDNKTIIDSIVQKPFRPNQNPIFIPVKDQVNIFIIYSTVWMDEEGIFKFYRDVYKRKY